MKAQIKIWRKLFREGVFKRDNFKCKKCGAGGVLDAHHITDRHEMPNDGYVLSNGISLCAFCHIKAEKFHITEGKEWESNFHPTQLYELINSSYEKAYENSMNL